MQGQDNHSFLMEPEEEWAQHGMASPTFSLDDGSPSAGLDKGES